jgi:hypothetical protein
MRRDDHYAEAEKLLSVYGTGPLDTRVNSDEIPNLLLALTHAVLASADSDVADPIPWT